MAKVPRRSVGWLTFVLLISSFPWYHRMVAAEAIKKDGELHMYSSVRVRLEPVKWKNGEPAYIKLLVHNSTDSELALSRPHWTEFEFFPQDDDLKFWGESFSRMRRDLIPVKRIPAGEKLELHYPAFLFFRRTGFGHHKVGYSIKLDVDNNVEEEKASDHAGNYSGYFTFEFKEMRKRRTEAEKIESIQRRLGKKETHDKAFQQLLFIRTEKAAKVLIEMCIDGKLKMGESSVLLARLARFEPVFAVDSLKQVAMSSKAAGQGIALRAMITMTLTFGYQEEVREQVKKALFEMIKHDRAAIQSNALTWLARLGFQDAEDEIEAQIKDENPEVRRAAKNALRLVRGDEMGTEPDTGQ